MIQFLFAVVLVLLPDVVLMSRKFSDSYSDTVEMKGLLYGLGDQLILAL